VKNTVKKAQEQVSSFQKDSLFLYILYHWYEIDNRTIWHTIWYAIRDKEYSFCPFLCWGMKKKNEDFSVL
ncbi:MAG: hypothetical protein K8S13_00445, partial [Desulfobacula sp.]|uniref:hypothetical protein n=1 Tax=Desulfobacula sp. TaxID=2593537 RepID=UPI0025C59124